MCLFKVLKKVCPPIKLQSVAISFKTKGKTETFSDTHKSKELITKLTYWEMKRCSSYSQTLPGSHKERKALETEMTA